MKNYVDWLKGSKEIEKKNFILNYKIEDNKIIISYADGKKKTIDFNENNINKLDELLKNQVNSYSLKKEDHIDLLAVLIFFAILITLGIPSAIIDSEALIMTGLILGTTLALVVPKIIVKIKKNDLKKNKLLLGNLEKINERFNKNPEEVYEILKNKNIDLVESEEDNKIKLNDADLFTPKSVSNLVDTINRTEDFIINERAKSKVKILKREKNTNKNVQ